MSAKKKKIGLLTPTLQSGGAERVMSITSQILTEEGYDVYILLYDIENINYPYNGKIINLKSKAGNNFLSKIIKRISRIIKLSFYKYKYGFDSVISFLYSANSVNYYSLGSSKKILACRGYSDYLENGEKYSKFQKKIDGFIVQTERMRKDFIKDFNIDGKKISVINNPFDIKGINEKSKESIEPHLHKLFKTHRTICTVGTFKKDKGYWHLIKAFTLVKKDIPDALLVFIGHRGEMENNIKNMAESTDYPNDIIFLGYQENPFKYIAKSDLYVCTSIYEGFPNSLLEAMASGAPVLSTDCKTGPREILQHTFSEVQKMQNVYFADYGVLIPNLDEKVNFAMNTITREEEFLAEGIIKLLNNEKKCNDYRRLSKKRAKKFDLKEYKKDIKKMI